MLGYLERYGGYLGLSDALLGPSWAILDAPTTRGPPVQVQGEGAPRRGRMGLEEKALWTTYAQRAGGIDWG